jgi:hypothetical protein
MLNLLSKLFRRKRPVPPFDIEKAVGHYLLTLPRCSNRVLVFSQSYQDKRFNFEMIVNATSLSAWAVQIDFGSGGCTDSGKAARNAFDLWLQLADLNDNSVTTLPKMFFDEIGEYHESFLEMRGNEVFCHECSKMNEMPIQTITEEKYNVMRDEWHCPNGHLLYQKVTEIYCSGRGFTMDYLEYEENDLSIPSFLRKKAD